MQVPLQVVFQHVEHSDVIETRVRKEAEKLARYYERITSVRVVVSRPQHRHQKGDTYSVHVIIAIPGAPDIAITRDPAASGRHEDIFVAVRDAFDSARRQLQDTTHERSGQEKVHDTPPHGIVRTLVPDGDHGFIESADGREIYFHRNSVSGGIFDKLRVGEKVRFAEALGDKGPQATFVQPIGK